MTPTDAYAIAHSIRKNHPFFRHAGYQPWGWDWQTFRSLYPRSAEIYAKCIRLLNDTPQTGHHSPIAPVVGP